MRDYSNVNIFVEEKENIEVHSPAMVVQFIRNRPLMRIIPSKKWVRSIGLCIGLINHESLHIAVRRNMNLKTSLALDNLSQPKSPEEFLSGVWGLSG